MANIYRRATRHGKHSVSVTLPKQWLTLNDITERDTLSISVTTDGALLIRKVKDETITA